jgi:hypothetical protein
MTQLFERCEKATQGGPGNCNLSEGFDEDILAFVRQQEQNGLPFFIDNPDVDGLVSGCADRCLSACMQLFNYLKEQFMENVYVQHY